MIWKNLYIGREERREKRSGGLFAAHFTLISKSDIYFTPAAGLQDSNGEL